jgi:hypothetical protein
MKSMTSQVRLASEVMAGSGFSSNWSRLPWRFIAAQEPDGTITGSSPAKTSAACFATLREALHSPELKAGWPQQVWSSGNSTEVFELRRSPRCSSTSTVLGAGDVVVKSASQRQVPMRSTRLPGTKSMSWAGGDRRPEGRGNPAVTHGDDPRLSRKFPLRRRFFQTKR